MTTTTRRTCAPVSVAVLIAACGIAGSARADVTSRQVIRADNASMTGAGLPYIPTGAGVRVSQSELSLPTVNGDNPGSPAMPLGTVNIGVNGRIYRTWFSQPNVPPALDDHATFVAGTMMSPTQGGIAQQMQLYSVAWQPGSDGIFASQYHIDDTTTNATILNMSWGPTRVIGNVNPPRDGTGVHALWADWASNTATGRNISDTLVVVAGNEFLTGNRESGGLDDFYNGITVGYSAWNGYGFYAQGNRTNITEDASPAGTGRIGRFKTDIVAPGGGPFQAGSGGIMAGPVILNSALDTANGGAADGVNSNPNYAGTSFAAPHVTAAAALLTDFANNRGHNTDHRVLKALLLNGASKNITQWNGTPWTAVGNLGINKQNGVPVSIGWDSTMGTGQLDATQSLLNMHGGQQAPGNVTRVGYDLRTVTGQGTFNQYILGNYITSLTATLCWDRFISLNDTNGNGWYNTGETFNALTLNDLDLEIWALPLLGAPVQLFASTSDMDSIEHLAVNIPAGNLQDRIAIRVRFFNDYTPQYGWERYGLAWRAVPTPGTLGLAAVGLLALARRRR